MLASSGEPPLVPLRLAEPPPSARRGPAGAAIGALRRALVRLLTPLLADLLTQLERDRHRTHAALTDLERRVRSLESGPPDEPLP